MRVIVVGGGPGGSRCAELLSRLGARVVLYEPRSAWEKPCGGGVPERGVDSCPFLRDPALPQRLTTQARIYSPAGREALIPLSEPLRVYSRKVLNGCLLDRALRSGAELRPSRVAAFERTGGRWRVRDAVGGSEEFDFLVGADGASGVVRSRVDRKLWPREQTLGVGYYIEGYTSDEIILKFYPDFDGYLWIFPRTDHLAAGICGPTGPRQGEALLASLQRFLTDLYGVAVLKRLRRYGARIPCLPAGVPVRRTCQGDGWALIGDAAGFVDPLTREGIHYALASSEILAGALSEGNLGLYGERWERGYGSELNWAVCHRALFFSRRFIEAFTLLSSASLAVQKVVSDLIAGRQSYLSLRRRLTRRTPAAAVSLLLRILGRRVFHTSSQPPPRLTPLAG